MAREEVKGKRDKEKEIVTHMVMLYCKGNNHGSHAPCSECKELIDYANGRTDNCPFTETKTFCSKCTVHCYSPEMRENIKAAMRYSGPRMLLHNPVMAIKYIVTSKW